MLRQFLSGSEVALVPTGSMVLATEVPVHLRQRSTRPCTLLGHPSMSILQGPDHDRTSARRKQTAWYEYLAQILLPRTGKCYLDRAPLHGGG
jgi:hypothetical protein